MRSCSKQGCNRAAAGTLTYDYRGQTAVLGPLSSSAEPHTYDMCEAHMQSLTVPKGWDVVRLEVNYEVAAPSEDDLMELAEAVKKAALPRAGATRSFSAFVPEGEVASAEVQTVRRLEVVPGEGGDNHADKPSLEPQQGPFVEGPG